jgi:polar amino acid transport system substrate-binding protein
MVRSSVFVTSFLFVALVCGSERKPAGTIKPGTLIVGTYKAFAPVCWSENGSAKGRDVEFLRRFAKERGLAIEFRFFEFNDIWGRPASDECDVAAAGIAPLASRTVKGVEWSEPYFEVKRSLLIRKSDAETLRNMGDFANRTIAVTKGSTADIDTVARKPASTRVVYYDDQAKAIADLLAGRIDGFGEGDVSNAYLVEKHPDELALADVHPMAPVETFSLAVRHKSGIIDELNAFIAANRGKY